MINYKRKEIFKVKNIFYFLLLLPFIRTRTMEDFPIWLQNLYNYSALISTVIIFFNTFKNKKNVHNMKIILPIWIMIITYISITLFSNTRYLGSCYNCIFFLSIAMFINTEIDKNTYNLIKVLAFIYTTLILLNNILVILFPEGFYDTLVTYHKGHLLGDDNAIIYVALPGMILLSIYSILKNGKISNFTWFNIFFCEWIFIKLWAASAIVSFGIFIIVMMIGTKCLKLPPFKLFILLVIFCIIIFIGFNTPVITHFISDYLHKDITFSGRTYLWKNGFELIKQRPIFGYGGYFIAGRSSLGYRVYPIHTTHLQILIDGGIFLFLQYITIFILAFKKINKYKKFNIAQTLCAGLIAIGISYTFEQAGLYHIIILLTLALNIDKIINSIQRRKEENDNKETIS